MARSTPSPATREKLFRLASLIDEGLTGRGWDTQPTVLLHATGADEHGELTLGIKDVDAHPVDELLGVVAPDAWDVLGVSQLGWATPLEGGTEERPSECGKPRRRVRVTMVVSRANDDVTLLRVEGADHHIDVTGEIGGLVPDVLRRCLHLPTAPPDAPVTAFFAAVWFASLRAVTAFSPGPLTWSQMRALHPAARTHTSLSRAAAEQARGLEWGDVRWQTVERRWPASTVTAEMAAWFDDGSFSRWVHPTAAQLGELAASLTDDALRRTVLLLRRLGIW